MELLRSGEGFQLFYEGREIINHSYKSPFIFAGIGEASYDMYRGNFEITNEISEKMALSNFQIHEKQDELEIDFSRNGLFNIKVKIFVEENLLKIKFSSNEKDINRVWIRIKGNEKEHLYGCGEQFSHFDLKGKIVPLWVSEQGVGRNKKTYETFMADVEDRAGGDQFTTFYPQPTFVSSNKYFLHVKDSSYMKFDFSKNEYHQLEIWNIPEEIVIGVGENYIELLKILTDFFGRQPELPFWVYDGVWLGVQGGTDVVLKKLKAAEDKGVKVGALWAQDWEGKRVTSFGKRLIWNWVWHEELYPGLDKEIPKLNEKGVKFLGYINPYLSAGGSLFIEAESLGYLVKNVEGKDYLIDAGEFDIGIVDITNPKGFEWYKGVIRKYMIDFGLSGWMADFGEYLPTDAVLHNGLSGELMHNLWPTLWAKVNRQAIEDAGKLGEIVFFMRSGYAGSSKYNTMAWAGDQNVNWELDDGLPSVIPAALSLGMSGMGLSHSDIGGYTTLFGMKRTKELFIRWAEQAAFTPMMRTHEGNRPDDNWQFDSDEETLEYLARMNNIFMLLAPYTKSIVKENSDNGTPTMRPLFLHYENDEKSYDIQYQYLYGKDIMVAPVIEDKVRSWKLYLPEDNWVNIWTGEEFKGGEIQVNAELGYPPVLYRKDSNFKELFEKITKEYGYN